MDTKRTFVVATDHTRKFEYCARNHISSPLRVRRRHQIMPSPRSATGPQRPCKRLHSAFSWPRHSAGGRARAVHLAEMDGGVAELSANLAVTFRTAAEAMAEKGLRVLALAW